MLLPVGGILFGDSLAHLAGQRADLLDRATSIVDSVLTRDAREVSWQGPEALRRAVRRTPAVGADPTRLPTGFLLARRVEALPEPLWSSLRALGAVTGAQMAVVPVAAKLDGREGSVRASLVFALVDSRLGRLMWRGRVVGPAVPGAEAALAAAAAAAVPGGVR